MAYSPQERPPTVPHTLYGASDRLELGPGDPPIDVEISDRQAKLALDVLKASGSLSSGDLHAINLKPDEAAALIEEMQMHGVIEHEPDRTLTAGRPADMLDRFRIKRVLGTPDPGWLSTYKPTWNLTVTQAHVLRARDDAARLANQVRLAEIEAYKEYDRRDAAEKAEAARKAAEAKAEAERLKREAAEEAARKAAEAKQQRKQAEEKAARELADKVRTDRAQADISALYTQAAEDLKAKETAEKNAETKQAELFASTVAAAVAAALAAQPGTAKPAEPAELATAESAPVEPTQETGAQPAATEATEPVRTTGGNQSKEPAPDAAQLAPTEPENDANQDPTVDATVELAKAILDSQDRRKKAEALEMAAEGKGLFSPERLLKLNQDIETAEKADLEARRTGSAAEERRSRSMIITDITSQMISEVRPGTDVSPELIRVISAARDRAVAQELLEINKARASARALELLDENRLRALNQAIAAEAAAMPEDTTGRAKAELGIAAKHIAAYVGIPTHANTIRATEKDRELMAQIQNKRLALAAREAAEAARHEDTPIAEPIGQAAPEAAAETNTPDNPAQNAPEAAPAEQQTPPIELRGPLDADELRALYAGIQRDLRNMDDIPSGVRRNQVIRNLIQARLPESTPEVVEQVRRDITVVRRADAGSK